MRRHAGEFFNGLLGDGRHDKKTRTTPYRVIAGFLGPVNRSAKYPINRSNSPDATVPDYCGNFIAII